MGQSIGKVLGLSGELPNPLGPYKSVGTLVVRPPSAPQVQIFYPSSNAQQADVSIRDNKKGKSEYPYTRKEAAHGLAQWMGMSHFGFVYSGSLAAVKHPFRRDAPLHTDFHKSGKQLPVVLFSHGLGGNMEIYSKTCADIASHGYIVVAMEHEDGSGSYSLPEGASEPKLYTKVPEDIEYTRDNVIDFRKPFLEHRRNELRAVLNYILSRGASEGQLNSQASTDEILLMDKANRDGPSDTSPPEADLVGTLLFNADLGNIFLAGHSFGGASTVFSSRSCPEIGKSIKACVLLDLWPFPVPYQQVEGGMKHHTLSVLSEQFALNNESPITLKLKNSTEKGKKQFLSYYLPGTMHQFCSDTVWWTSPKLGKRIMAIGEEHPQVAQAAFISAIAAFMKGHTDLDHISTLSRFEKHHTETK